MEMLKTERVLITGGAGFIGHRVANILHAQGLSVAVVDNLAAGLPMPAIQQRLRPFLVDVRDKDGLARAFDEFRPDRVVHLAAVHHIPTVEKQRDYAHEVDIIGTELVLGQCERHQIGVVTMASSAAVYAPVEGVLHEDTTPLQAIDNYSLCKLSNEHQAKFWTERTGGKIRLIRFFNTVGHDDPTGHLLPDILNQIQGKTGEVTIGLGNTTPRRDYVHVDDSAAAAAALTTEGEIRAPVEAFNICRGEEFSVLELVEEIGRILSVKIRVETDPARVRPVDRQSILGSNTKLRERTGWMWRYDFPAIVRRTVEGLGFATKA